jgi:hypothetical protein
MRSAVGDSTLLFLLTENCCEGKTRFLIHGERSCGIVKQTIDSDQTIVRYLLNELSEEEQSRFEEAYLADESVFEDVLALEEELIEEYVRGNLSGHERQRFERHYLGNEQHLARIENARRLVQMASFKSPLQPFKDGHTDSTLFSIRSRLRLLVRQRSAIGFGVAVALLLLLGSGLLIGLLRLRGQLAMVSDERAVLERRAEDVERQLADEREQLTERQKESRALREQLENLSNQLNRLKSELTKLQVSKNHITSLAVVPGNRGKGKPDVAIISAQTNFIELQAILESGEETNLRAYRAVVKTVEGDREIWTQSGLKPQRRGSVWYIAIRMPANRFRAVVESNFTLTLSAPTAGGKDYEVLEGYYFQVIAG